MLSGQAAVRRPVAGQGSHGGVLMAACPSGEAARCARPARRRWRIRWRGRCRSARSKAARIACLVVAAHRDDEGKAELGRIGVVELGEARRARRRSARRARRRPARRRFRRQALGGSELAGEIGVRLQHAEPLVLRRGPERAGQRRLHARPRVSCAGPSSSACARSAIQGECSKMPPKRATKASRSERRGPRPGRRGRMPRRPVLGDVDAAREPDLVVPLGVVEEARQRRRPAPAGPIRRQCSPTDIIFGLPAAPSA